MISISCTSLNIEKMNPAELCAAITKLVEPLEKNIAHNARFEFCDGEPLKVLHLEVRTGDKGKQSVHLVLTDRTGREKY